MTERMYEVGKIVNTHGIKGEVKVFSVTDFPEERYRKGSRLVVIREGVQPETVTIESARLHKNTYIVKFAEYSGINEVEKLKGGSLKIAEEDRGELEEDEFYFDEIIGSEAWTDTGELLGTVKDILSTGANDVWVVETKEKKEILIPYIDDCILEVNVSEKKIKVHLLEGLV